MDEQPTDIGQPQGTPATEHKTRRPRRGRQVLLAVALAGGLAAGGAGVAAAASSSSTSSAPSASSTSSAPSAPAEGSSPAAPAPEDGTAGPGGPAAGPGGGPGGGHGPAEGGRGPADGEHAHQPHLDGEVASVSDDSFTLVDHDGFTRTVSTTDDTTYRSGGPGEDGATEDREALLVEGAHVSAVGEVADDGTTLAASAVETRPEPPQPPAEDAPAPPADAPAPPAEDAPTGS